MSEHVQETANTSEVTQYDTPKKSTTQDIFLEDFSIHGNVSKACRTAGIERKTLYRWKERSTTFLFRYNQAVEAAKDNIREEIYRRAHDGWDEEVYQLGKYAGDVHKYSDTLLMFHAKAIMPEYREKQQIDINGTLVIKTEWGGGALEEEEVQHGSSIS